MSLAEGRCGLMGELGLRPSAVRGLFWRSALAVLLSVAAAAGDSGFHPLYGLH